MAKQSVNQIRNLLEREVTPDEFKTLEFDYGKRHDKVKLVVNNKRIVRTFPSTPSDRRWIMNWRADFRRLYRKVREL